MKKSKILNKSFGSFVREIRLDLGIGQRELAKKIGIAASYLNDIEKEKRTAPKINIIKKLSVLLNANKDDLNDLAGISKKSVAPDIGEYIESNPNIISLIRTIKDNNLNDNQIGDIETSINKNMTKALIIAAGLGSRLKKHTENLPKCMLDFGGKTLLERQLDAYKKCGIKDISVSGIKIRMSKGMTAKYNLAEKQLEFYQTKPSDWALIHDSYINEWAISLIGLVSGNATPVLEQRFNDQGLTGCLTIYNSELINSSLLVTNGQCEDSLNLVRTSGREISIKIDDAFADAVDADFSFLDIGGLGFLIFSICYLWSCYYLYKLKKNSRVFFLSLVFLFVIFGFLAELIKPMQISHDFFYIFVFYIVSPLFFILQGIILTLIYFTDLKFNFVK